MLGLRWFGRSASYEAVMAARVAIGGFDPMKSSAAHAVFNRDQTSRFFYWEAVGNICVVGFIRRSLDLHRSEIDVTGLLEFVGF